jgi:hypothetical protein
LRARVEDMVKDAPMMRRPSCGLPITLGAELLEKLCGDRSLRDGQIQSTGRLWAIWLGPQNRWRPAWASNDRHTCCGFKLRIGGRHQGRVLFQVTKRHRDGVWAASLWSPDTRQLILRGLAEFAGSSDGEIAEGARLLVVCRYCFRKLTDPISIECGIGPECFSHSGADIARTYQGRQASEDQFERVIVEKLDTKARVP